jgi:hypothetical protein
VSRTLLEGERLKDYRPAEGSQWTTDRTQRTDGEKCESPVAPVGRLVRMCAVVSCEYLIRVDPSDPWFFASNRRCALIKKAKPARDREWSRAGFLSLSLH